MYISRLDIEGYKNCKNKSSIELKKGLNILVGENSSGKTTIINALRMILRENEYSYMNITEDDFYKSFSDNSKSEKINIDLQFECLSPDEEVTFLTWCDADFNAQLHLEVDSKPNRKGYYKKSIWGGVSKASAFEEETFECIDCVYLPPLRDAVEKLTNGRKSRLATLLKHQYESEDDEKRLVEKVNKFNEDITNNKDGEYEEISKAKNDINTNIEEAMGSVFGQSINLQFAETTFTSILRSIKMVFFPEISEEDIEKYRDIAINSLGYNNLLYIATVLAELKAVGKEKNLLTILLIEEPEAHLHPQLQIKLINYLEKLTLEQNNLQIIVTTHSPVLASSVDIDNIIHINENNNTIIATQLAKVGLGSSKNFINRWLDITKSTLLFSRGIIFVEGISESMLLPELAKIVLHKYNSENTKKQLPMSLEEAGVSIVNMNGIYFKHFMKFFCNVDGSKSDLKLPIRCAAITDNDPGKDIYPINQGCEGKNSALDLVEDVNKSDLARLYSSPLKTFEYDLSMENNTKIMSETLIELWETEGSVRKELNEICNRNNEYKDQKKLREDSITIYTRIDEVGKGIFAQRLAEKIKTQYDNDNPQNIINVPNYIYKAIVWACGGGLDD